MQSILLGWIAFCISTLSGSVKSEPLIDEGKIPD